jgi:hypothetical protein
MPYTGIVLAILASVLGLYLILLCHWLVAAGLFPKTVTSFETEYQKRPVRATLVGLLTLGPLLVVLANAARIPNPLIHLAVLVVGFGAVLAAIIGSAGLAMRIGNGLCPEANAWQRVFRGGSVLSLCFLTPFVGTFFVLPVGLCSGFGVFLLAKPWKSDASSPASNDTAPAAATSASL